MRCCCLSIVALVSLADWELAVALDRREEGAFCGFIVSHVELVEFTHELRDRRVNMMMAITIRMTTTNPRTTATMIVSVVTLDDDAACANVKICYLVYL